MIRSLRSGLLVFGALVLMTSAVSGQSSRAAELEREAREAFAKKDYPAALAKYNRLLEMYPRDPGYNYHAGVCMVELGQEPQKSIYRLKIAALHDVPEDVYFYLGKAYYQSGNYEEAVRWYERFGGQVSPAVRKRYHLEKYIGEAKMAAEARRHLPSVPAAGPSTPQERAALQALAYRHRADSLEQLMARERQTLATLKERPEREEMQQHIARHEQEAARYRQQAGIWAARAGEGNRDHGSAYTIFGPGKDATHISAPVGAVSEKEAAPFLELAGEDFYKNPDLQKIITPSDRQVFEECRALSRKGDELMKAAWKEAREADRQKMVVNTSTGLSRSRAEQKVRALEKAKEEKRLEAVKYFRQANGKEYALNKRYITSLLDDPGIDTLRRRQGRSFHREAERAWRKAQQLHDQADKGPSGERYDRLMQADAYERMALDAQRKAILTLAGLMPAPEKDMTHLAVASRKQPVRKKKKESSQMVAEKEEKIYRKPPPHMPAGRENVLRRYPFGLTRQEGVPVILPADSMPPGVNYRLQIGVFGKSPDPSYFKGMYPLFREEIPGKGLTRYYAGQFRTYGEAAQALLRLRKEGYRDAVLVAFRDGRREEVARARELEDPEPFVNLAPARRSRTAPAKTASPTPVKTSKPGLIYRVQVGVFRNPLPKEKLSGLEELAGWDHVVIRTKNNQGYYTYAIGNFATFEEAAAFRNKLAEQGLSGCFVTAYRNGVRVMIGDPQK